MFSVQFLIHDFNDPFVGVTVLFQVFNETDCITIHIGKFSGTQ